MTKKYNLALTPASKGDEIVQLAQNLSKVADKYLLGKNSLPHVTIYQFEAEEKDVNDIWERVCELEEKPIDLQFDTFSCVTFDNSIYWASLMPDNCDILHKMHGEIARILGLPIKKLFDPHMTLISSKDKEYKNEVDKISNSYAPITDTFVLSLGLSDNIGQLTEIIHRSEIKKNMTKKM